jgi:hypothetical protein
VRSHRRREDIRRDGGGGQPLAGLEVSQRLFVTAKSEVEQAARIVEAYPGGRIWTSLILLWISRSMPDRTCNRSCGMPVALSSGRIRNGSRQARHSPNLARRHGGDQGCRPATEPANPGSRPAGVTSGFPGPDGRSAGPRRVMASGSATPVEGFSLTPFGLGGVNHQNM